MDDMEEFNKKRTHARQESFFYLFLRVIIAAIIISFSVMVSACEPYILMYCISDPIISIMFTFQNYCENSRQSNRDG
jgi:hypothetical protein